MNLSLSYRPLAKPVLLLCALLLLAGCSLIAWLSLWESCQRS